MGRLQGKVVVVTGASRGIGFEIARVLSSEGAILVVVARGREALRRAASRIPGGALALVADVTRPADVRRLFRNVRSRYRRLDVLVNSAGIFTYKPFIRTTLRDWQRNISTNLTSLFLTTRAALPLLARSRSPQIVNILSTSSRNAFTKCSAYTAAKFGALGLTRVLAEELRPRNIRVTAIMPGPTNTRLIDEFDFPVERAALLEPEDVAQTVLGALLQPPRATVEEILLMPAKGRL